MDEASKTVDGCASAPSAEGGALGRGNRPRVVSYVWGGLGAVFFALGAAGAVLPLIPTTPFILLAALCFTRSSAKLNRWFRSTKLCRTVFENYLTRRVMTWKEKLRVLVPVFLLLSVSFVLLEPVPAGRVAVVVVFVAHVIYFGFVVKTDKGAAAQRAAGAGVVLDE